MIHFFYYILIFQYKKYKINDKMLFFGLFCNNYSFLTYNL